MANIARLLVICKFRNSFSVNGFTLIEIMVALTIIAISLGALLSTSGSQANNAAYLKQKTIAHWVASYEITKLQIEKTFPGVGDEKGSTEMAGHEWFWIRTTIKTQDENARQVELKIFSDKQRIQNLTRLIGYVTR